MRVNKKHEEDNQQESITSKHTIAEDLRKSCERADREGWISDDEMQKIMKD